MKFIDYDENNRILARQSKLCAYGFDDSSKPKREKKMEIQTELFAKKGDFEGIPTVVEIIEVTDNKKGKFGPTIRLRLADDRVIECFPSDLRLVAKKYGKESADWKLPMKVVVRSVETNKSTSEKKSLAWLVTPE